MEKIFIITYSQNAFEYTGTLRITAESLTQVNDFIIIADNVKILFDEEIESISLLDE